MAIVKGDAIKPKTSNHAQFQVFSPVSVGEKVYFLPNKDTLLGSEDGYYDTAASEFFFKNIIAGEALTTDSILEETADTGVTADGVLLKDGGILTTATITTPGLTSTAAIDAAGQAIGCATLSPTTGVYSDNIYERTSSAGVTIDGVLARDSYLEVPGGVRSDILSERLSGSGITADGVLFKDSNVSCDTLVVANKSASRDNLGLGAQHQIISSNTVQNHSSASEVSLISSTETCEADEILVFFTNVSASVDGAGKKANFSLYINGSQKDYGYYTEPVGDTAGSNGTVTCMGMVSGLSGSVSFELKWSVPTGTAYVHRRRGWIVRLRDNR